MNGTWHCLCANLIKRTLHVGFHLGDELMRKNGKNPASEVHQNHHKTREKLVSRTRHFVETTESVLVEGLDVITGRTRSDQGQAQVPIGPSEWKVLDICAKESPLHRTTFSHIIKDVTAFLKPALLSLDIVALEDVSVDGSWNNLTDLVDRVNEL
ncbi:uncharacterized protein LOC131884236 [Tigriopus californicus]|uniref:uncharacterized protein LOC131884236 n=1 Tax=Tigriopus californicus TaxID=6832 RepID=UPI0027DA0781|nr:uncharacterized protein LOC131884236 [Tigriopus californicus]